MRRPLNDRFFSGVGVLAFLLHLATPTPLHAGIFDLLMTEVDPANDKVEITNNSTTSFTAPNDLYFCHRLVYNITIPSGTMFAAGESKTFTITGLNSVSSDLWLFTDNLDFGDPSRMITGIQFGAGNLGRSFEATTAGLWPAASTFLPLPTVGETLQLRGLDSGTPAQWDSRPTTVDAFFGTGTAITDPLSPNIQQGSVTIELTTVVSGLTAPQGFAPLPDGPDRNLIFEQTGEIHLMEAGVLQTPLFLDVSSLLVPLGVFGAGSYDERGLLGVAVAPDYTTSGKIYTYTSQPVSGTADFTTVAVPTGGQDHQSVIAEWTRDGGNPDIIDPLSRREILRIDQPQFNHNAGTMRFGPDGFLYVALGDGGGADDEDGQPFFGGSGFVEGHGAGGNGQNPLTIYGSVIRIDPNGNDGVNGEYGIPAGNPFDGVSGLEEVWAYGLRNPFSFSFDSMTGELYLADVGQNDIEEVNVIGVGDNLGWRLKEGTFFFDPAGTSDGFVTTVPVAPLPSGLVDPIAQYDHDDGLASIGGFVYRGSAVPEIAGLYIFGDFGFFTSDSGRLFYVDPAAVTPQVLELSITPSAIPLGLALKGFGEDANGELYVLASGNVAPSGSAGVVLRIDSFTPAAVSDWAEY